MKRHHGGRGRVLVCAPLPPAFDRESGGQRIFDLVALLRELQRDVTFLALDAWSDPCYENALRDLGVPTIYGIGPSVQNLLASEQIDYAFIHFWRVAEAYLPLIRLRSPSTRIIVDTVDIHFLREARQHLFPNVSECVPPLGHIHGLRFVRELNIYSLADTLLTVSDREGRLLTDFFGSNVEIVTVPDWETAASNPPGFVGRKGVLFVGNFWHKPNLDAITFFVDEIWGKVPKNLRRANPFIIVGNGLDPCMAASLHRQPDVRVIGWVESLAPYYATAKVSAVPLRFGAGTKRKVLQSMAQGLPTVSTDIGIEGMRGLRPGRHLLVANTPLSFADAIAYILQDPGQWKALSESGLKYVAGLSGRNLVKKRLVTILSKLMPRPAKIRLSQPLAMDLYQKQIKDRALASKLGRWIRENVPQGSKVLAIHDGELDYLRLTTGRLEHWLAGEAINLPHHRASLSNETADPLFIVTSTSIADRLVVNESWLETLSGLKRRRIEGLPFELLTTHADRKLAAARTASMQPLALLFDFATVDARRPTAQLTRKEIAAALPRVKRHNVLVVGAYLADSPTNIHDIVETLAATSVERVTQRWACLSGAPPTASVSRVTVRTYERLMPKWVVVNELLCEVDVSEFDYVIVIDDDIVLPAGFVDIFLAIQDGTEFAIAQPARTSRSYIDHPIVEQQNGVLARKTWFVESGPVVSFRKDALALLLPFDESSPMGWGYTNRWAYVLKRSGHIMGIIDAAPVDHGLRKPTQFYCRGSAHRERVRFLSTNDHLSYADCYKVEDVIVDMSQLPLTNSAGSLVASRSPVISVVVATYRRRELLKRCLDSLADQSLARSRYEILVVDDGSPDGIEELVRSYHGFRYFRIRHSGKSAAKNLGLFAANGEIVHFFDDDDAADLSMLEEHLRAHRDNPQEYVAILGHTALSPQIMNDPLMHYVTEIGGNLFSYSTISDGDFLDFRYFWEGRISCKKNFLVRNAIHKQDLEYYIDIEMAYRLSSHGLIIKYHHAAKSYMIRKVSLHQFCKRCEAKGQALFQMLKLHADSPAMREYCQGEKQVNNWQHYRSQMDGLFERVNHLQNAAVSSPISSAEMSLLHAEYKKLFAACLAKGYVSAMNGSSQVRQTND